jgi:signal transduction histidine kinase/CheY-like chemotaxis protein
MIEKHDSQEQFQQLLIEISSSFINLPLDEVEPAIDQSLGLIGSFVGADRAYIFDFDAQTGICTNTHEWCMDGIDPQKENLQGVPLATDWVIAFSKNEPIYIYDVSVLPEGHAKEVLSSQGIKSLLAIPLTHDDTCIGFVGFDSVKAHYNYADKELQLLNVFSYMLMNVSLRRKKEQELVKAKEKAEASDRLKTAFMNNISHEIRTPLNHIIGYSQMVIDTELSLLERARFFELIKEGSDRLLNTINDYMDISLLASGNMEVNFDHVFLSDLMNSLMLKYRRLCIGKHLELSLQIPKSEKEWVVLSDQGMLEKALGHLLDNAVKFTQIGSVSFGFQHKDKALDFFVKDTGIGIAHSQQQLIFERFLQADSSTTRGHEGSGLGLAIVNGIAELLHGKVQLQSRPGHGSIFYFSIPYTGETHIKSSAPAHAPKHAEDVVILIVEDDVSNKMYLRTLLKKNKFKCIEASNGKQAVEICQENPSVSLVIMDLKLPIMDGYEATLLIKKLRPDLPVIAVSAHALTGDREKALRASADKYIAKPFQQDVLLDQIRSYLAR